MTIALFQDGVENYTYWNTIIIVIVIVIINLILITRVVGGYSL